MSKRRTSSVQWHAFGLALCALIGFGSATVSVAAESEFPAARPRTRLDAAQLLRGDDTPGGAPSGCLTPDLDAVRSAPFGSSPAVRRGLGLLQRRITFADEQVDWADGVAVRYTVDPYAFDRIQQAASESRPQIVDALRLGLDQARRFLTARLELPPPPPFEVQLVELGDLDGYFMPGDRRTAPGRIVLDSSPAEGLDGTRRAAIHQYVHAVLDGLGVALPAEWAEGFATWALLTLDGAADPATVVALNQRLDRLSAGLLDGDRGLGGGNALWFAFLDEAHGPSAVRATLEELARGGQVAGALDRGVRRVSRDDLASAFREFQLWSTLVGERSDGRHFPFADRLTLPPFASSGEGLPAISVQSDPTVADLGTAQVLLRPHRRRGGLNLHFEGEFGARWETDLLLVGKRGELRRLPLTLTPEGRGEVTIPLHDVEEILLLIRNLGSDDGTPKRYTYAAHAEAGFPFEIELLEAVAFERAVRVRWSTSAERGLIGFNVLRRRQDGGETITVNPVWIPAAGGEGLPTDYSYFDATAESGVAYVYRVEGITQDGLTAPSDPVRLQRPVSSR